MPTTMSDDAAMTRGDRGVLWSTEVVLRAVAVLCALAALALVLGPGLQLVSPGTVPDASSLTAVQRFLGSQLIERTEIEGPAGVATVSAVTRQIGSAAGGSTSSRPLQLGAVEVSGPTEVTAAFLATTSWQRWAWIAARAASLAGVAAVLWLLAQMLRSARRGDPFVRTNTRRLRAIAVLVGGGGTAMMAVNGLVRRWLLDSSELRGLVPVDFEISLAPLFVGVLLALLAEVWRRGVSMREDLEGLV